MCAVETEDADPDKEVDIPTLVHQLVIEAHKKKMASRAQSRESLLRSGSRQSR